jgi:diguanylate cyclase (GGDEF)-like protein
VPLVWPRMRRRAAAASRDVRLSLRELDPDAIAPRVAALVFLVGGLLALAVDLFVPGFRGVPSIGLISAVAAVFGAIAVVVPWPRFGPRAGLAIPAFAFVLFAWGGVIAHGTPEPYLAMLPLPFVFVGITQPTGTASGLAPFAIFALVVADRFRFDATLMSTVVFALPMLVLVGEALAFAQTRRTNAEARVERLLEAVRILARVDDQRIGAQLVASLAAELLGADAVAVLLADRPGSRRLLNRAFFGHPALADATPLLVDALGVGKFDARDVGFISDPNRVRALTPTATCVRAAATVPLPGEGLAPIGVIIAMWTTPRRRLHRSASQAAELLSEEAGRMFRRLRASAELTHDAETDPLTQLANRRTFARALTTMRPGDALVLVDLDHFKDVNDRHGHQVGDETLRVLARDLRDTARQVDCVARYGGEEFAVVLPEAGIEGAQAMLHRFRRVWQSHQPLTTFSAGIARHEHGRTPRETLRLADAALYAAKAAGRDCDMLAAETQAEVEIVLG